MNSSSIHPAQYELRHIKTTELNWKARGGSNLEYVQLTYGSMSTLAADMFGHPHAPNIIRKLISMPRKNVNVWPSNTYTLGWRKTRALYLY